MYKLWSSLTITQESSLSYEHLRRQVDETMGEKEQYIQSANDAAKVKLL